jgi:hypothetical protein
MNWFSRKPAKTSKTYWARQDSYPVEWGERARQAAAHIAAHSSVLDIGCGKMQLKSALPDGCTYTPADQVRWTDEVVKIDLDQQEFPPGNFDCVVILGVLEYLQAPAFPITRAADTSRKLITSYCHPLPETDIARRRQNGWVNDLSEAELTQLFTAAGWTLNHSEDVQVSTKFRQRLYVCTPAIA